MWPQFSFVLGVDHRFLLFLMGHPFFGELLCPFENQVIMVHKAGGRGCGRLRSILLYCGFINSRAMMLGLVLTIFSQSLSSLYDSQDLPNQKTPKPPPIQARSFPSQRLSDLQSPIPTHSRRHLRNARKPSRQAPSGSSASPDAGTSSPGPACPYCCAA